MIGRLFSTLWRIINFSRLVILNLIFILLLIIFIAAISSDKNVIEVPKKSALLLNLQGQLVEQKERVNPVDTFIAQAMEQQQENPEVLIDDVLYAINTAKHDDNITTIILQLEKLQTSGLSKLQTVGKALADFKTSGKQIIASGGQYSQSQYYLASYANKIWLNPKGWLMLDGFGSYQLYFKTALEKLGVTQHIFRVGTYKSAVEPFMRDNMSTQAKEANKEWLNDLWHLYKEDVAQQRNFSITNFDENAEQLVEKVAAADGNIAQYALQNGWVDELKTNNEVRQALIGMVGKTPKGGINQINFKHYLHATKPVVDLTSPSSDKVAIIVAKGNILNGKQKPGTIGGQSTAALLRKARNNDNVKAVVLRVDSPGGSAYASEVIRQEVELLKAAGKPVVASMGTYAASGGYWISAPANKIIAAPSTITGSIGIFGLFMTFEESLSKLGVYTDGVGTTDLAGVGVTRPLNDNLGKIIQLNINRGYQDFLELVAKNRSMTIEQVDKIAQGRVWSGVKAKELGLVDELGDLDDAINTAASLAGLEAFDRLLIEKSLSPMDKFLANALGQTASLFFVDTASAPLSSSELFMARMQTELKQLNQFNDPNNAYLLCLVCGQ